MHSHAPIAAKPLVIYIEPDAPAKPPTGAACNGCGVCCAAEPCPVGMTLFRKRRGACPGLLWEPQHKVYRCAVVVQPEKVARMVLPAQMGFAAPLLARTLAWGAKRWIAVGVGCDSALEVVSPKIAVSHDLENQP
jgi:hypothetical protein